MLAPRYMYARRRLFADVGKVLTDLVGERGTITKKEEIPVPGIFAGAPSLDYYIVTNKQGIEIGRVQVNGAVSYSLSEDLTDVGNSLGNRYSADRVSELTQGFAQEHDQLHDDLGKKLEALPTEWIRDIPDLAVSILEMR